MKVASRSSTPTARVVGTSGFTEFDLCAPSACECELLQTCLTIWARRDRLSIDWGFGSLVCSTACQEFSLHRTLCYSVFLDTVCCFCVMLQATGATCGLRRRSSQKPRNGAMPAPAPTMTCESKPQHHCIKVLPLKDRSSVLTTCTTLSAGL